MSNLSLPVRYGFLCWLLVIALCPFGQRAFAQRPATLSLVMGTSPAMSAAKAPLPTFLDGLAHEIFSRMGIGITLTPLPAERALINVNSGLDDGDMFRPAGIDQLYPNLIRVPERILNYDFVAYTKRTDIRIRKLDDLKPYSVGFPNGWKNIESRVREVDELYSLIDKERVDVIIIGRHSGSKTLDPQAQALHLLAHDPPLVQFDMFMYLNKKHASLVPQVAQVLKDMKAEGSFKKILDSTLNRTPDR
jgi:polar amino acid transport system substrate-binding protein